MYVSLALVATSSFARKLACVEKYQCQHKKR